MIDEGDYGWCLYDGQEDGSPPRVVYYDDDEAGCSEGLDEDDDSHVCETPDSTCYYDTRAIVYPTAEIVGPYDCIPYESLHVLRGVGSSATEPIMARGGWVYAIAVVPDIDMRRIKVGFTTRPIGQRLAQYRTANPTAMLLGLWDADHSLERLVHHALPGRINDSEVFHVTDLEVALEMINKLMAEPRP